VERKNHERHTGKKLLKTVSLLGVLLVIALILSPTIGATAAWEKMDVCHVTNVPTEGDGGVISIADPAWGAHEAHGEKMIGERAIEDGDGKCHLVEIDAIDEKLTTPVDTLVKIDVLANDTYIEPVVVSVQVFPQYGILGIVDIGIFEYTPNAGFVGTDNFTYQICDTGGHCDTATVTITVGP
jgi:hypothetical protein